MTQILEEDVQIFFPSIKIASYNRYKDEKDEHNL